MVTKVNDRSRGCEEMDSFDALYGLPLKEWLVMDQKKLEFIAVKVEILHHLLEGVQHFIHQLQKKGN